MLFSLVGREEIRRLEKAAREKDKKKLEEWMLRYEEQIKEVYRRHYEQAYKEEIELSINNFLIAIAYTLHFTEEIELSDSRLQEIFCDLFATIDLYRTGEYKPDEFLQQLKDNGIILEKYDYFKIYQEKLKELDEKIAEYDNLINKLNQTYLNSNQVKK